MKIKTLSEGIAVDIGHAFGYYDYGTEHGLIDAFPSRDAVASFICGYTKMAFQSGMLHATSEAGEGFIAYKFPGQKVGLKAALPLAKGLLGSMNFKELIRFATIMSKGGPGLGKKLDKAKKPYIYVGMVCVREPYQGQGYMRRVMDMAFAEGDRLGVPVILDTDAKSKCGKYVHLGMTLAGTRRFGEYGVLYDLIRYPCHGKCSAEKTTEDPIKQLQQDEKQGVRYTAMRYALRLQMTEDIVDHEANAPCEQYVPEAHYDAAAPTACLFSNGSQCGDTWNV